MSVVALHPRQIKLNLLSGSGVLDSGSQLHVDLNVNSGMGFVSDQLALGTPNDLDVGTINIISGSTHAHKIISASAVTGSSILSSGSSGYLNLAGLGINATPLDNLPFYINNHTDINGTYGISQYILQQLDTGVSMSSFVGGLLIQTSWGLGSSASGNAFSLLIGNPIGTPPLQYAGIQIESQDGRKALYSEGTSDYSIFMGNVDIGTSGSLGTSKLHIVGSGSQLRLSNTDYANDYATFLTDSNGYLNIDVSANQLRLLPDVRIQSDNYISQVSGWSIAYSGAGDFRYIFTDELHAKAFIADLEQALAGGQIISKSVAILYDNFELPSAGGSSVFYVQDLPSAPDMLVFEDNDFIGFRQFSRSGGSLTIAWGWGTVVSGSTTGSGYQGWTYFRDSGSPGSGSGIISASSIVLDFGVSGNGYYEVNAIDGLYGENSPYSQIVTWDTSPENRTARVRSGNLKGITAQSNEYGLYAGDGVTNSSRYIRLSSTNFDIHNLDVSIHDGTAERIRLDHNEGIFVWAEDGGSTVLGVYSGSATKSWGGSTLAPGDLMIGDGYTGEGGQILYQKQSGTVHIGSPSINHIEVTNTALKFKNGYTNVLASLTGTTWVLGGSTIEHIQLDSTSLKIYGDTTTVLAELNGSTLTLGEVGAGKSNTYITSGSLSLRNNTTDRILLKSTGILSINNSSGNPVFTFDASAGAEFTLPLTLGTSGGIYQGSGTFASPTTGLKIWNVSGSGRIAGYNSGGSQAGFGTDGIFYAGGGNVRLSASGLEFNKTSSYANSYAIKWNQIYGLPASAIYTLVPVINGEIHLDAYAASGNLVASLQIGPSNVFTPDNFHASGSISAGWGLSADGDLEISGSASIVGSLSATSLAVISGGNIQVTTGDIYTTAWTDYSTLSTIVGWSSYTVKAIYYKKVGKLAFVNYVIIGTSNSTSTTFTVPYVCNSSLSAYHKPAVGQDNGSYLNGTAYAILTSSTSTLTIYADESTAAWTASGTKAVRGQFWYETS